jgi:hypothetical protein
MTCSRFHARRCPTRRCSRGSTRCSPSSAASSSPSGCRGRAFFPAWYGSEAGRWRDSHLSLAARTLFGAQPPDEAGAKAALDADRAFALAPSEKYDLAHADYGFAATLKSLQATHNARPRPRFWFGLCNGVAAAAIDHPEPFRAVDVKSPDGHVVRFHPVDVKALLAHAYYFETDAGVLGGTCHVIKFNAGKDCSMNPGGLLIGTVNQLGRARRSHQRAGTAGSPRPRGAGRAGDHHDRAFRS